MKKLFTVHDSFLLADQSIAIGGVNSELDPLSEDEIRNFIGKKVVLRRRNKKDLELHVKGVEVSVSLINKKNIFINILEKIQPSEIPQYSEIYSQHY